MSEAALTLSTAPIWSGTRVSIHRKRVLNGMRTSLCKLIPNLRQFNKDDISQRGLRVVGDSHNTDTSSVVVFYEFMVLCVPFGWKTTTSGANS